MRSYVHQVSHLMQHLEQQEQKLVSLGTIINVTVKHGAGNIMIDDSELNESTVNSWRKLVGYVQQEVFLIDGSLAENIALGFEGFDREQVLKVAEKASLSGLIEELPDGIDSRVGERGSKISGGQRQRVGIARALYSGAKVLFFDEATSSLDSQTEYEITEAINNLAEEDLTMFVIAHRHSTLKYCDRVFEINKGVLRQVDNVFLNDLE